MDIKLRKRVIGFLLLIGFGLILIPLFFGRSIPEDELKLSSHVPEPPSQPHDLAIPMPDRVASVPDVARAAQPVAAPAVPLSPSAVVFEQVQSTSGQTVTNGAKPAAVTPAVSNTVKKPTTTTTTAATPAPAAVAPTTPSPTTSTPVTTPTKTTTAKSATHTTTTQKSASTSKAKATAKTEQKIPAANAWVVQLGSFSDKTNADTLVSKLQSQGFKAYTKTTQTSKGLLIRVLVGPELKRADAETTVSKLKQQLHLNGIIVSQ